MWQIGGCGFGVGFGYGLFLFGLGMPVQRLTDVLGFTRKTVESRFKQEKRERELEERQRLPMPCEQEEEHTMVDDHLEAVMQSIQRRRERMRAQ